MPDVATKIVISTQDLASADIGRIANSLGGLGSAAKTVGAAFAGIQVGDLAKDVAMAAARFDTLGVAMEVVGRNAGYSASEMANYEKSLQRLGISMIESRQALTQMITANMDLASASKLAREAQDAAAIGGLNSSEAFQRMAYAIQSAQPEMLRTIGINVSFEASYAKMATRLGVATEALDENQKMQARTNEVLAFAPRLAGVYEASMATAGKQVKSFERYIEDLKVALGEPLQARFTELVKSAGEMTDKFTSFAGTEEGKKAIKALGDTAAGTAEQLGSVGASLVSMAGDVVSGWSKVPEPIRSIGMVGSLAFGLKGLATLAAVSAGVQAVSIMANQYSAEKNVKNGTATTADKLLVKKAELADLGNFDDRSDEGLPVYLDQTAAAREAFEARKIKLQREIRILEVQAKAGIEPTAPGQIATPYADKVNAAMAKIMKAPQGPTFEELDAGLIKSTGGGATDATLKEQAYKKFMGEYAKVQQEYALAKTPEEMSRATKREADVLNAYGKALDDINKKGTAAASAIDKADAASRKLIDSLGNTAMAEQAALLGDTFGAASQKAVKNYEDELNGLDAKLAGYKGREKDLVKAAVLYWADYRKGIAEAKIELDAYNASLDFWAKNEARMGELTGDLGRSVNAGLIELQRRRNEELRAVEGSSVLSEQERQDRLAAIRERYALEEVELRRKTLGDAAQLSDGYFAAERAKLEARLAFVKANASNETAYAVYAAQERDKLAKAELDAKIKYTGSFSEYVAARLAEDYGLYKDALTRQRDLWAGFYDALKKGFDGVEKAAGDTLTSFFEDAFTGQLDKGKDYWKSFTDSLKKTFADMLGDLAKLALHNYIVVPIMGAVVGSIGGGSGALSIPGLGKVGGDGAGTFGVGDLTKLAGAGGSGWLDSLGSSIFGTSAVPAGFTSAAGGGVSDAAANAAAQALAKQVMANGGAVTGGGAASLSAILGPAAMAGGLGYMAGGLFWPGQTTPQIAGLAAGALGGGVAAATPLAGAIAGALGISAGLAATGVGLLAAIPAALLTGSEQTVTQKTGTGGIVVNVQDGSRTFAGFDMWKQSKSGMFGSSSTSHFVWPGALDPQAAAALDAGFKDLDKTTLDWADALKLSQDPLAHMTTGLLAVSGIKDVGIIFTDLKAAAADLMAGPELQDLRHAGEDSGATLTRLATAITELSRDSQIAGLDLQKLSGGLAGLKLADYASNLMDVMGGAQGVQNAFAIYEKHTLSSPQLAQNTINYLADMAGKAMGKLPQNLNSQITEMANMLPGYGPINSSTLALDPANFWQQYQQAMGGTMSPEDFKLWSDAATAMDSLSTAIDTASQSAASANAQLVQAAQQTASAMGSVVTSIDAEIAKLNVSADLSPLTGTGRADYAASLYDQLLAKASGGDQAAMAQLAAQGDQTIGIFKDVYGASEAFFNEEKHVSETLGQIRNKAQSAYDAALAQIDAIQGTTGAVNAQTQTLTDAMERVRQAILKGNEKTVASGTSTNTNPTDTGPSSGSQTTTTTTTNPGGWSLPGGGTTTNPVEAMAFNSFTGLSADNYSFGDNPFSFAGYDEGGVSTGKQLAWVSEGRWPVEAHVPLPDGRSIPVNIRNSGQSQPGRMIDVSGLEKRLEAIFGVLYDLQQGNSQGHAGTHEVLAEVKTRLATVANYLRP